MQRVAQGQGADDLAAVAAGTMSEDELRQRNTGTELENRIAIAQIGNIVPPRLEIRDARLPAAQDDVIVELAVPSRPGVGAGSRSVPTSRSRPTTCSTSTRRMISLRWAR